MDEMVRVKMPNGSEATITAEQAKAYKLDVLDKPAVDARGYALSDKPRVELPKAGSKYDGMKPEELAEEAAQRQLAVEGTGANGNVLKADLVTALVTHDAELGAVNT